MSRGIESTVRLCAWGSSRISRRVSERDCVVFSQERWSYPSTSTVTGLPAIGRSRLPAAFCRSWSFEMFVTFSRRSYTNQAVTPAAPIPTTRITPSTHRIARFQPKPLRGRRAL